ncbi:MerR family transcriptional regulator [Fundicoccus culcitae]|uniref:MerR family transcriptional regulator n=1 Tax=Fundicoccus culcitae TaxID=2969821 RepID=A0ABY5P5W7_9LACT|nr:MerR family transcriptional regulator [Fundicoccus culcitae]UUX33793.1 MerR family transcriptional regulator [Fundicoccus culcitae]
MKIGEVSQLTGINIDTLRYYDRIGLVSPIRQGKHRHYQASDIETLEMIQVLKAGLFSLDEILELLKLDDKYQTLESVYQIELDDLSNIKQLVTNKTQLIDEKIASLQQAQQLLQRIEEKLNLLRKED